MHRIMLLLCLLCWMLPAAAQEMTAEEAYQEALGRIEAARVSGATKLDLLSLPLTELPAEIGQLTNLQVLNIYYSQLTTLPAEIGQLTNLQELWVSYTPLTTLPSNIGQLKKLYRLFLNSTQLMSLPPEIGQLANLSELYLENTPLHTLPPELGQLTKLEIFDLYNTPLTFPPPEIMQQGTPAILAYLRDYQALMLRQTVAGIAAGVGGLALLMVGFRWKQRSGTEKKKRA